MSRYPTLKVRLHIGPFPFDDTGETTSPIRCLVVDDVRNNSFALTPWFSGIANHICNWGPRCCLHSASRNSNNSWISLLRIRLDADPFNVERSRNSGPILIALRSETDASTVLQHCF